MKHSVPKYTDLFQTLENGITDKAVLGNKGAGLVEMHKLDITVPQSLFLTTTCCQILTHDPELLLCVLNKLLLTFDTNKLAIRSSGVISMPGMMDTVLDVENNEETVAKAIMDVIGSWDSERAKSYRKICNISEEMQLAIIIQPMIRGEKGCSGICFSRNPNNGNNKLHGEFLPNALGDALASGKETPEPIINEDGYRNPKIDSVVTGKLIHYALILEHHFKHVQDMEFVFDGKDTYLVQTRNAALSPYANVKSLIYFYERKFITLEEFKIRLTPRLLESIKDCQVKIIGEAGGSITPIIEGTSAVNGIVTARVFFDKQKAADNEGIWITDDTTPDDLPYLNKIKGLITRIGGMTSHPAVVCRQLQKPCIVGAYHLTFNYRHGIMSVVTTEENELSEGSIITMVGEKGAAYHVNESEFKVIRTTPFEKQIEQILKKHV